MADETLELADETNTATETEGLAQDSSSQFTAIERPVVDFDFKDGNFAELLESPVVVAQFVESFVRTVLPVLESTLVVLLGNSNAFVRSNCETSLSVSNNQPKLVATVTYGVEMWIGEDIDQSAIAHDAKFVYDKLLTIDGLKISRCEIDCTVGQLVVEMVLSK